MGVGEAGRRGSLPSLRLEILCTSILLLRLYIALEAVSQCEVALGQHGIPWWACRKLDLIYNGPLEALLKLLCSLLAKLYSEAGEQGVAVLENCTGRGDDVD